MKLTDEQKAEMMDMRQVGYTYDEIAEEFNVSQTTARYHLNEQYKGTVKRNDKKRKKKLMEKGLCRRCGEEREGNRALYCNNCLVKRTIYKKRRRFPKEKIEKHLD